MFSITRCAAARPPDGPRPRRERRSGGAAAGVAGLSVIVLVLAQVLLGAPAALASPIPPKGAYWFTLLDLQRAWRITEGNGVTVAVVDSGVEASVNTLRGQVEPGLDLSGHDPHAQHDTAVPGNGDFGHGTDMAALIAGTGRGGELPGVAPQAKILPVDNDNPNGDGHSSPANTARGIDWAVSHGADIINLSLGASGSCNSEEGAAIAGAYRHGIIVVASAGDSPGPVLSPANCPGALAVGGIDAAAHPWTKTASGPEVDFVAPAVDLVNQDLHGELNGPAPGNAGTSQAAAIVSGIFALLRARFPHDSARELVTRALYNVHNGLGRGKQGVRAGNTLGYGVILPAFALTEAPPHGAKNAVYDRFATQIAGGSPTRGAPSAPPSGSSGASGHSSRAPHTVAAGTSSDSGGTSLGTLLLIGLAVVIVLAILVGLLVARGRHRRPPPPPPRGFQGLGYPPTRR